MWTNDVSGTLLGKARRVFFPLPVTNLRLDMMVYCGEGWAVRYQVCYKFMIGLGPKWLRWR